MRSRTREALADFFEYWGRFEYPQIDAHLYRALCPDIARDADLLAMAARAPATQPPPNLLFAAVHDLLLAGTPHPLRAWYATLSAHQGHESDERDEADAAAPVRDPDSAFPVFRAFCLAHRAHIEALVATRLTQTNVVQRASGLLPAFARVFGRGGAKPLALIEIGPSAGLNLQWDRFRYRYASAAGPEIVWGDAGSPVSIECALQGPGRWPALPREIPVAWRRGVDLHPIDLEDAEAVRWLRALVVPEHVAPMRRLAAAIAVARANRPAILEGDASLAVPDLIAAAPAEANVCVYGTHTLYQFPPDALRATLRGLQEASRHRDVWFVSCEGTGDRSSELKVVEYRRGEREVTLAGRCSPHGSWLEWLAG
jgi:hypothetical protein